MALGVPTTTPVVGGTVTSSGAPYQSVVSHAAGLPVNDNLVSTSARASDINKMSEREYEEYVSKRDYERGLQSDSSKYQRAYKDIVKAGLNPRLLLQSGADTNMVTSSSSYGYSKSESNSSSNSFSWSALAVGLLALAIKLL